MAGKATNLKTPDITPAILLQAYIAGVFPMADSADAHDIFWVDPTDRGIIPLDDLRISKSLRKRINSGVYTCSFNQSFDAVLANCADRDPTWINPAIAALYNKLHKQGHAHSVEIWADGALVGGLYGIAIQGAFFGESMFSTATDASKVALVVLVERLRAGGFALLDTQFLTPHLQSLGGIEISRAEYQRRLNAALFINADHSVLAAKKPYALTQLIAQMS